MSHSTPDVEIRGVTKEFGSVRALDDVSLSVASGRFFSLLGPSGCGKTTLLRLIGGFEQPDTGSIEIVGEEVTRVPPNRRPTALVFQRWALFPHMSVVQNIGFGLKLRRVGRKELARRVAELVDLVGLTGLGDRRPAQLSGGQQQRVALARALAIAPKVLLLDEPLSALDLKLRGQMQLELKRLQRDVGTTFLYVTHDQSEAMTMSDAIAVINGGRVEQVGSPQDIYDRPKTAFVSTFIGDTNLLDVRVESDGLRLVGADGEVGPTVAAPATMPVEHGQRCAVSLRYERVSIGRGLSATNRFSGKVREAIFSGASVRYLVALDTAGLELVAAVPHYAGGMAYQVGEPVEVGWDPDAAVVVRD